MPSETTIEGFFSILSVLYLCRFRTSKNIHILLDFEESSLTGVFVFSTAFQRRSLPRRKRLRVFSRLIEKEYTLSLETNSAAPRPRGGPYQGRLTPDFIKIIKSCGGSNVTPCLSSHYRSLKYLPAASAILLRQNILISNARPLCIKSKIELPSELLNVHSRYHLLTEFSPPHTSKYSP